MSGLASVRLIEAMACYVRIGEVRSDYVRLCHVSKG